MSATVINGQVERVVEKQGKFGAMFSLLVNGNWYGTGKTSGGVKPGDYVEFAAETNARGFTDVVKGTLKPAPAPAGKTASVAAPAASSNSYDSRQDSIVFQSSRKDALAFVGLLLTAGKLDFGKAKGADAIAVLEAYVDKFTEHFVAEAKSGEPYPSQADDKAAAEARGEIEADRIPF